MAGQGLVWQGRARSGVEHGTVVHGGLRLCLARCGTRLGTAWRGKAWQGEEYGLARRGKAR